MTDILARLLGGLILGVVFGGVFMWTVKDEGWRTAALIWSGSIAVTLLIMVAVFLLIAGVPS